MTDDTTLLANDNATRHATGDGEADVLVRRATANDLPLVIELDGDNTGLHKPDYWGETFHETERHPGQHFLIAESASSDHEFLGFIVGEVRAWEFGSRPCGWILTIGVVHERRVAGVGSALFDAICERFAADGVKTVRTMLARHDQLNMSFFRSQGMMAGSFIELEKPID